MRGGGGGEIRWENVRQEEGEIFFLSFICSVSLLRVGDPRGGSQFLCVCGPVLYSMFCR